jgi:hypothetical protein
MLRAYTYVTPWWLALLSMNFLTPAIEINEGFFVPGFCPFKNVLYNEDLYKI